MNTVTRIKASVAIRVFLAMVLGSFAAAVGNAQVPSVNDAKPKGKIKAENNVKLPPTVSNGLIPKLELVSTDDIGKTKQFNLKITNWTAFPPAIFKSEPNLPPNPCGQPKLHARLALRIIRKEDGKTVSCKVVTSREDLQTTSFRTYDGSKPEIYGLLIDVKTATSYKSKVVSTAAK